MNGLAWFSLHVRTRNQSILELALWRRRPSLRLSAVDFSSGHPTVDILWKEEIPKREWPAPLVNIRLDRTADVDAAMAQLELIGDGDE